MKLLIYVNSMDTFGGIERVIANLSSRLSDYCQVTILVKNTPKSAYPLDKRIILETLNCPIVMDMSSRIKRLLSVPINSFNATKKLKNYLSKNHFDVIYTAFPMNALEVYQADRNYRSKLIASEHASYYAYNKVYQYIKCYLYPKLKAISVPTTMDTEIYQKLGYQAIYIPHLTTFGATELSEKDSQTIINVGRLTADKQQLLLLKIWEKVNHILPNHSWKLQLIGSGEEEQLLVDYIKQNQLDNVEMVPHTPNISEYYSNAELFVFTSKMEGFGMVLLEAMSFGVPCISFDCPSGPRDIIKDSENGYLVSCYDEDLFVKRICDYIEKNTEDKRKLQQAALETILTWDNQQIIQSWLELFNSLEKK